MTSFSCQQLSLLYWCLLKFSIELISLTQFKVDITSLLTLYKFVPIFLVRDLLVLIKFILHTSTRLPYQLHSSSTLTKHHFKFLLCDSRNICVTFV